MGTPAIAPDAPAEADVLCPSCGYDLRGTDTDRCSECGLAIDRAALKETAIPWAHRKSIGRVRAFARTVWQFTFDSRRIRLEASRPQKVSDARAFRRVIAVLLMLGGLVVLGINVSEWE